MRAQWESAVKSLGPEAPATASPYAVSFFTLVKHWKFRSELERCSPGGNALPDGDFERTEQVPEGWQVRQGAPEELETEARIAPSDAHDGRNCLTLQIRLKAGGAAAPPAAIEPAYVGVTSAPVTFPPGTLVRISGWIKVAGPIEASPDGALFFDSAGGEPLGVRITAPMPAWKPITLYRRTPATGQIQVTAALTGIGSVYFDDLKIEPLSPR
jgi:hypothetical protein